MKLKPFRDYSEHDVVNLFALTTASGDAGQAVKVAVGWKNNDIHSFSNMNSQIPNVYMPRHSVNARVALTVSGDAKPFGMLLYGIREKGYLDYPLIFDTVRKEEMQVVVSGEAVPIVRKGLFLVSGFAGTPNIGSGVSPSDSNAGEWKVTNGTAAANNFGEFLGPVDAQGFALVQVNFYK